MMRRLFFVAAALAVFARLTVYADAGPVSNTICLVVFAVCTAAWAVSAIMA